ncbi:hypothetical protein [Novacetimonas pomaceti]|uniref:Uncharacterized protein n=1 Tax=Novacetimonas pomaceti TaxID=2021998 RepID=A0A318QBV5_9PROT|nr:hypothetical protein [Novacetimonas pomaceti]MBV1833107.1 hypothetical protein [Novacetimonas pomaceti]PYD75314.1 hypothetical protein CFR71_09945 [Novacetimonas pomaceti]
MREPNNERTKSWTEDPYFTDALDALIEKRERGLRFITLDMEAISEVISNCDGPAYRLLDAMVNIKETEGYHGMRGAPRVLLATLYRLAEISKTV